MAVNVNQPKFHGSQKEIRCWTMSACLEITNWIRPLTNRRAVVSKAAGRGAGSYTAFVIEAANEGPN